MKKFLLIFLFASLFLSTTKAGQFYWVGGTGRFNDPSMWATTSGGSTLQSFPPNAGDSIYFDVNSFLTANDTVYFDSVGHSVTNFIVSGVLNTPVFYNSQPVTSMAVFGDFYLDSAIQWLTTTEIEFNSGDPYYHTIQTNGNVLSEVVQVSYGPFKLLDDLHCANLTISGGGFETSNHNIDCWYANIGSPGPLYFGTSVIHAQAVSLFMGTIQAPVIYADSAKFIAVEYFEIDTAAGNVSIGTVQTVDIMSTNCLYKELISPLQSVNLIGTGNHVDLVTGNISVGDNAPASNPNFLTTVMAVDTFISTSNNIVDTLLFSDEGPYVEISDTLEITGEMFMDNTPSFRGDIQQGSTPGNLKKMNGILCTDFANILGINATGGAQFFAGYNSTDFGGNMGWTFTGCVTQGGAWPGDANYDLVVNNLDILALGVANGETGPMRAGATNNWVEQPVADWTNAYVTGVNYKHADCDGNGVVDSADTAAIYLNYGLHHPASRFGNQTHEINSAAIITIEISPDSAGANTPLQINIDLSTDSIYGIAFSVYYDPTLIDAASLIPDFNNSWLGTTGVNMIGFAKADPAAGRIDFALTRTDHTNAIGGAGHLLSFDLTTAATIPTPSTLAMQVDNVNGIYSSENYTGIAGNSDSTYVDELVSVHEQNSSIRNLTSWLDDENLSLQFYADHAADMQLTLTDLTGRNILAKRIMATTGVNKNEIPVGNLADGIYFLSLSGERNFTGLKLINRH